MQSNPIPMVIKSVAIGGWAIWKEDSNILGEDTLFSDGDCYLFMNVGVSMKV